MTDKMIDSYIGVDFSIVNKVSVVVKPAKTATGQTERKGEQQYYCKVPEGGIDPANGRKMVPHQFSIS